MSSPTTSRMPREQRRSQLLRRATEVFSEKGYQATSMDDIASAAGVTKPVLYQHFRSKESLYVEVLDLIGEDLLAEVRSMAGRAGGPADRVRAGLQRFYEYVALKNSLRLFTGYEVISPEVQERVGEVLDAMAVELAAVLTSYRELSEEQSRTLGRGLISLAQTTAQLLHDTADEAGREVILSTMTTAVVDGLTAFTAVDPAASEQSAARA